MRKLVLFAVAAAFSISAAAYEVVFTNQVTGIPSGWQLLGSGKINVTGTSKDPDGREMGLCFSFGSTAGSKILGTTAAVIPSNEIPCDRVYARIRLYQQTEYFKQDLFQIVISTNNWENYPDASSYQAIGDPIMVEEPGRTVREWVTFDRQLLIPGLSASGNNVSVGVLATAAGTGRLGYWQSLDLRFVAVATPQNVCFEVGGNVAVALEPGETNAIVSATINEYPSDGDGKVTVSGVKCVLDRNGVITTNEMTKVGPSQWETGKISPAIEAGEFLKTSVFTEYTSNIDALGKKDAQGIAREQSEWVAIEGAKKGSVWINEFAIDQVELCGTTNRVMFSGWWLELSDRDGKTVKADLSGLFDFTRKMINGVVGLETRSLAWKNSAGTEIHSFEDGDYVVRLRNSAGIVEHEVAISLPLSGSSGMTGCAVWKGWEYDWSGTATNRNVFTWGELSECSFGMVNEEQGFKVPVVAELIVDTESESGSPLSYVTVIATATNLLNTTDATAVTNFPAQSEGGVARISIEGYSATPEKIHIDLAASAFGWISDPKSLDLADSGETRTALKLSPTVATDDFDGTDLKSFWVNEGTKTWELATQDGRRCLRLNSSKGDGGIAILRCSNFLSPRGHKYASVSFDYRNWKTSSVRHDYFHVEMTTNANWQGETVVTPTLTNNVSHPLGDQAWYRHQVVVEMPEWFASSDEIWIRLVCESMGSTMTYTHVDNLRIAFENVVLPTNLTRTVEKPASGGSTGFVLDVLPQTTDEIEEVSADLHITVNGVKKIVPFAHPDGSLTNSISIPDGDGAPSLPCSTKLTISPEALEKALGTRFYAGDTVKYYAEIRNNSGTVEVDENGVCKTVYETRYFPDNATIDDEGRWVVEGAYKAIEDQYGFTIDGPDIDILGTPVITADGIAFDYHAWDRTGNKGIVGLTATVRKEGEEVSTTSLFEGAATNRVTDTCALTGLDANTEYTLTISGKRNSGGDLTSKSITFVTRPVLTAATIEGTSPSTAKLTASGQAAGFVVTPSDWVQGSDSVQGDIRTMTWTRGEGTPNSQMSATVYATNKVGLASMTTNSPSGFTLAAVATKAPVIQKGTVTVDVGADQDYVAGNDSNPELTEYAVRVTTSDGGDALVKTNGVEVWKTLADWKAEPVTVEKPTIDLLSTNYFSFISRNFDETVSPNDSPVTTNCTFDMTAEVAGAEQTAEFGKVDVALKFSDPAQSDDARAEVEYKIVGKGDWASVESFGVPFDEIEKTTNITWDAWTAVGETEGTYEYLLRAKVTDAAHGRSSGWVEMAEAGTLDFVKPTVELTSDTPDPFPLAKSPMKVEVKFSKPVTGFTKDSLSVVNGTAKVTGGGDTYTVSVTPKNDGVVTVQVLAAGKAKDKFGNTNKASDVLSRTYDTTKPTELKIDGEPQDGVVTNGTEFAFIASATDMSALTFHWTTNGVAVADNTSDKLAGTAIEGTNTVSVYAEDAAGNACDPTNRTWVVDTKAPTEPEIISGKPDKFTKNRGFSMTASSVDATKLTFWWSLNGAAGVRALPGEAFERDGLADGEYTVSVYATDEAMNVSPTNHYSWTIDNVAPDNLKIEGKPAETPFVTTVTEVNLTASATDNVTPEDKIAYAWTFNGGKEIKGANLNQTPIEGTNTAKLVVTDEAGNQSELTRTWVVDTHCPTNLVISGWPMGDGSPTNEPNFCLTATAMDATAVTFWWSLDGAAGVRALPGAPFTNDAELSEGNHVVSVYATDEAVNVSETNYWAWTVDRTPPAVTNLTSTTPDPFGKGAGDLLVTVMFSEPVVGFDASKITVDNGATVASVVALDKDGTSYDVTIKPGDDGLITVKIEGEKVKDRAGNWNTESGTLTRTYDTKPPENFQFEATPKNTEVVATSNFNFAVSATDTTTVTYYWKTNAADYVSLSAEKKDGVWVANFEGLASEGTNTLSVYGTDQLGNPTVTNSIWWVVDTFAPTNLVITGWPANGAYTNETSFSLKAEAMDATQLTYHWTLKRGEDTASTWEGQTFASTSKLDDGDYTVMCYAEDEAHNVSETTNWTWTVDTVHPTVKLTSSTPKTFNEYKIPLIVNVEFIEAVSGFDSNCVTVTRGVVTNWTGSGSSYTVYIDPDDEDEKVGEAFVPVTVQIEAGKVRDLAGNPNEASDELQFRNVTKFPTVSLETTTRDPFRDLPFEVTATFVRGKTARAAVVTNFTAESVSVTNGTVKVWPDFATNVYTITVTPVPDSVVTVQIPAGVVADDVGNPNEASIPLVRTYDVSAPEDLRFLKSSTPSEGEITASRRFNFEVTADDLTALTYTWKLNKELAGCTSSNFVSTADVPKGTNIVSVFATDAAGNYCDPITRTWIVDYIAPTNFAVTGTPGVMGEIVITNGTFFSYVADATDDTRITYCWTTNGVVVADNPTNLVGTAIETTNTVTCYAMDQAKNVSETNTIVWVVDTIAPELGDLSGTPKAGDIVATNGFAFATSAEDATALTYHWTLNGDEVKNCTTSNYVDAVAVEGTNTLMVYATDAAGNASKTTNSTWWVVDRIAPTVPELSGAPADGAITNGTGYGFTATSTDDHLDAYYWSLDGKAAPPALPGKMFEGNVAEGYATHSVEVYATDKAGNKSVPTNWTWTVDTVSPTNLVITGIPPAVTNVAAFTMTASALDDTAISYHWLTNGIEVVSTNLDVRATEGTNTVQVWAEDAAHNVSTTNTIRWILDTIAPTKPVIDGKPTDGAITKDTGFWLTASSVDKTGLTFWWKLDGKAVKALPSGEPFTNDEDLEDGEHVVSVYATDEAGNVSEDESSIRWTLDTIAPKMPVIVDASPASNSFVNVTNYNFTAAEPEGEEDATAVKFFWRIEGGDLDGKREDPVTNFTGEVGMDGAYTAFVYAKDAAGNISPTNSLSWTVDTIPPVLQDGIGGTPANGSVTNNPNYDLTVVAEDATKVEFNWWIIGEGETPSPQPGKSTWGGTIPAEQTGRYEGLVDADGKYTVFVYAKDAAGNVSQTTNSLSWTSDRTGPTNLVLSVGTPSEGAVVATNGYDFTASAMDLTAIEYSWVLNGKTSDNTTSNLVGTAAIEGTNTLSVTATDAAGNPSEETLTRTWVVDTFAPTNLVVTGTPGDGALTNGTFFSWTASAQDATRLEYHWSMLTNGVEAATEIVTNAFTDVAVEGTNTVTVYAKDEAGNVSVVTSATWMVDLTLPTVTLSTEPELPAGKVINLEDIKSNGFMVHVMFSEPVAGFTAASVTITNGNGEVTAVATNSASSYTVWVMPAHDGLVPLQIADGAVKDLAGNGNVASDVLERTCDITPPKVTSITSNRNEPYGYLDELDGEPLKFTLLFSEAITNFTSASVTVTNGNGTVTEVVTNSALSYTVTVDFVSDGRIPVMVAAGAVTDLAGNDNEASDVLTRTRDTTDPELIITGTPEEGDITSSGTYDLTAQATDLTELSYLWVINDEVQEDVLGNRLKGTLTEEGDYLVEVWVFDAAGNFAYDTRSWTYEKGDVPSGIDFGESVQLKISDVSVTNVEFTAVDFQPGKKSTFALREFELKGSQETTKEITDLKMWFIVGTNPLDDIRWDVKVDEDAKFDNGTLTVTIPGEGTTDENTGKPYESFFIFKIDNKE